jgi:hypothetical protein
MTIGKKTYGVMAITTIVLMFATTIGSAINTADAQRDRHVEGSVINQQSRGGGTGDVDQRGLVNVGVGNLQVEANVAVPVDANVCGVISSGVSCR